MTNVGRTLLPTLANSATGMFVQNVLVSKNLLFHDRNCETESKKCQKCL